MLIHVCAWVFVALTVVVLLFQAALIAGLPWGAASMGGKFPGKYPPRMRFVAALNMLVMTGVAAIVLARAGLLLASVPPFARVAIWGVVVFAFAGAVMNTITPSRIERIWAPVTWILLACSIVVALG